MTWEDLAQRVADVLSGTEIESLRVVEGDPAQSAANAATCREIAGRLGDLIARVEQQHYDRRRSWFRKPSARETENHGRIVASVRGIGDALITQAIEIEQAIEWWYPPEQSPESRHQRRTDPPDGFRWAGEDAPELVRRSTKPNRAVRAMASGQLVYFGCSAATPWVDVYARKRRAGEREGLYTGDYECFGFHMTKNRWSYGEGPPGAREIRTMMEQLPASWYGTEEPRPSHGGE